MSRDDDEHERRSKEIEARIKQHDAKKDDDAKKRDDDGAGKELDKELSHVLVDSLRPIKDAVAPLGKRMDTVEETERERDDARRQKAVDDAKPPRRPGHFDRAGDDHSDLDWNDLTEEQRTQPVDEELGPSNIAPGRMIMRERRAENGALIREFFGSPASWMNPMAGPRMYVNRIAPPAQLSRPSPRRVVHHLTPVSIGPGAPRA